jgi:hypothetical protein
MTRQTNPQPRPLETEKTGRTRVYNWTSTTFYEGQKLGETNHPRLAQTGLIQIYCEDAKCSSDGYKLDA